MSFKAKAAVKQGLIALGMMMASILLLVGITVPTAHAAYTGVETQSANATRTIMIYLDGASSEENGYACTDMLKEYMASKFDRSDFRIIVMTGGSLKWHLDASYLRDKDGHAGTLEEISEIMSMISLELKSAPCILYNHNGFYDGLKALLAKMIEQELSDEEKQRGIFFEDSVEGIIARLS